MPSPGDLERIYDDHAQAIYGFLLNCTRHESDTRDLLQQLFVKLGRIGGLPNGVRDERRFLLRMAHHLAIDLFRRQSAARRAHERSAGDTVELFATSANPDESDLRRRMGDALGSLPSDQRAVLHLKLWEGLTFEEIAATLEIPLNTAASRYRYGLDKLRARLRPLYTELNGKGTKASSPQGT